MVAYVGITFVWLTGLTDFYLTHWMINYSGADSELNGVARWLAAELGSDALLSYKIATLVVFTAAVLVLRIGFDRRRLANQAVALASTVHLGLGIWWHVSLAGCPGGVLV